MENWEYRIREEDFPTFLKELVEWKQIEGAALGVAKQVLAQGIDSLSEKQLFVFKKHVIDANTVDRCERCASQIAWYEMGFAHMNGGYCGYCEHMRKRALEED